METGNDPRNSNFRNGGYVGCGDRCRAVFVDSCWDKVMVSSIMTIMMVPVRSGAVK